MKIGKLNLGKWKIVLMFFVVMFVCTIVSRAADALTLPKVTLGNVSSGKLKFVLEGDGNITSESEELVFLPKDVKIVSAAAAGVKVEAGDVLAEFDMEALGEACSDSRSELQKLKLNLEQEKLNGEPTAWQREQDAAQRNVTRLEEQLDEVRSQLGQTRTQYEQKSMEAGVTNEQIEALKDEAAQLEAKEEELSQSLSQAQETLELAKSNDEVTEANQQRQRKLAEFTIQSLQIDIEEKQREIEILDKLASDEGRFYASSAGTITETTVVTGMITTGSEYFKIGNGNTKLFAYLANEDAAGLKKGDKADVSSQDGKTTTVGTVQSVQGSYTVQRQDGAQADDAGTGVANEGAQMQITVKLEENELPIGALVHFKVTKESKEYQCIIPLSVVREDSQGAYVLVAEEKSSILGREMAAERVAVRVLEKNDSDAAVESALTKDDKMIVGSNKTIKAGDRVREE